MTMTETNRITEILEYGIDDPSDARLIASRWHDGQSSAAYSYASAGVIRHDLRDEIAANLTDGMAPDDRAEIVALLAWLDQPWFSVSHSGGHRMMSVDGDSVSCLTCGALYDVVPTGDDPRDVEYVNVRGELAGACSGQTDLAHGYSGERDCGDAACDPSEPCEHESHDCDCLLCDS